MFTGSACLAQQTREHYFEALHFEEDKKISSIIGESISLGENKYVLITLRKFAVSFRLFPIPLPPFRLCLQS